MKNHTASAFTTVRIALMCLLVSSAASADPIVYTMEAVGSGSLGPNPFAETHFTLNATADTSQISSPLMGIFVVPNLTATISITGLGIAAFTIPTTTVANQNSGAGGMSAPNQLIAILSVFTPAFQSYDLSTSIGPIEGHPEFNRAARFATTAGDFTVTSLTSATFQAQIVPEPSSVSLVVLGSIAVGYYHRRETLIRRKANA